MVLPSGMNTESRISFSIDCLIALEKIKVGGDAGVQKEKANFIEIKAITVISVNSDLLGRSHFSIIAQEYAQW